LKCSKCQAENREGVKSCEECGAKMELVCHGCGARIPTGKKFCGERGQSLDAPKEVAKIDYSVPQSYTPKHLADKILTTRTSIEGERKLVTVLFADVANFTSLSSKLTPKKSTRSWRTASRSSWRRSSCMRGPSISSRVTG
jgi:hypothetical protein